MRLLFVAILLAQSVATLSKGVSWHSVDPFCGRFRSTEPKTFPIEKATIKLYRAKLKQLPCCENAETLGDVNLDKSGNFDLRRVLDCLVLGPGSGVRASLGCEEIYLRLRPEFLQLDRTEAERWHV